MTNSTLTRPKRNSTGGRRRRRNSSPRGDSAEVPREARTRGTIRSRPIAPQEITKWQTTSPVDFARTFRMALRLSLAEDDPVLTVARSRASLMTWRSASGLDFGTAEATRCRVFREECEARGVEPLNAPPFTPAPVEETDDERDEKEPPVPRGRALDGARVRLSGRR